MKLTLFFKDTMKSTMFFEISILVRIVIIVIVCGDRKGDKGSGSDIGNLSMVVVL